MWLTGGSWVNFEKFEVQGDSVFLTRYAHGKVSGSYRLTNFDPKIRKAVFRWVSGDPPTAVTYEHLSADTLYILLEGPSDDFMGWREHYLARRPTDSQPKQGNGLSWLEGSWQGDFEGNPFEAHYTSPEGGSILSMSKEFLKDGRCWIEFERFTISGDSVLLTPYPQGEKSVSFVLTGHDPSVKKAVFENKAHDFPTDITYEMTAPDSLRILVAGPGKDGRKVLTLRLARNK
jgi:hypothetical protein